MCGCPRDQLCDLCRAGLFDNLRGTAATRGEVWADELAKHWGGTSWPGYTETVAEIAMRKVADLTVDRKLQALLAAELAAWAARRWTTITAPA